MRTPAGMEIPAGSSTPKLMCPNILFHLIGVVEKSSVLFIGKLRKFNMFWSWLIFAILFIAVGSYVVGTLDIHVDEKLGIFWAVFIGSLLWPLVLTAVIIIGPFFGLFWLGDRAREKKKAALKDDEQK
jgi:hypothetical protein